MGGNVRGVNRWIGRACAAAALVGAVAHAQPAAPGGPRGERLQRLGEVIQRRLALTPEQGTRLRGVSGRFARERQALVAREREARLALRDELPRGDAADQTRVRQALDALVDAQQRRAALLAAEQRELAAFLTPVQRAQYLGLQERALRAVQRARGQDLSGDAGEPTAPPFQGRPRARRQF